MASMRVLAPCLMIWVCGCTAGKQSTRTPAPECADPPCESADEADTKNDDQQDWWLSEQWQSDYERERLCSVISQYVDAAATDFAGLRGTHHQRDNAPSYWEATANIPDVVGPCRVFAADDDNDRSATIRCDIVPTGVAADKLQTVFESWLGRLEPCIPSGWKRRGDDYTAKWTEYPDRSDDKGREIEVFRRAGLGTYGGIVVSSHTDF